VQLATSAVTNSPLVEELASEASIEPENDSAIFVDADRANLQDSGMTFTLGNLDMPDHEHLPFSRSRVGMSKPVDIFPACITLGIVDSIRRKDFDEVGQDDIGGVKERFRLVFLVGHRLVLRTFGLNDSE
jgi:hypothetical protein